MSTPVILDHAGEQRAVEVGMSTTVLDHTPRGHASRYVSACYTGMRDDLDRTSAYRRAIIEAAPGKVVVDLGTGALALLAIIAAEAGATHVYAIEVQAGAAASARQAVSAAGLSDKITVLHGFSTDASLELPAKADLLVHELIGEIAGEEGVVAAILDAAERHLAPSAQPPLSVPSRVRSLLAPCELPDGAAPGSGRALKLPALPTSARLAPPLAFEDLRFERGAPSSCAATELGFSVERTGRLACLAVHVELHCGAARGDEPADVSSAWAGSHWRSIVLLLDEAVQVRAGDEVRVRTSVALAGALPLYTFEAFLVPAGGGEGGGGGGGGGTLRALGSPLHYPEAALNCNEAVDMQLDRYAP